MAIVMTGLDQDQMQKNLSCRNLKDAQKNMTVFSVILILLILYFYLLVHYCIYILIRLTLYHPNNADMLFQILR